MLSFVSCACQTRFLPFLEHTVDMQDFCQREVEPMGKECEQVQRNRVYDCDTVRQRDEYCRRRLSQGFVFLPVSAFGKTCIFT